MSRSEITLTVINLAVCIVGFLMCVCRNGMMTNRTKPVIRAQYSIWVGYFVASAISFTFDEPPSLTQVLMSTAVAMHLLLGFEAWRGGAPQYTVRGRDFFGDLGD